MSKTAITSPELTPPVGPFSQAIARTAIGWPRCRLGPVKIDLVVKA